MLRQKLIDWFVERKTEPAKWNGYLCSVMEARLEELIAYGRTWRVKKSDSNVFEVLSPKTHIVDFMKQTCTCCDWQLKGFPCSHAVAASRKFGISLENHIQSYWFVDSYKASYENPIYLIPTSLKKRYEFAGDPNIQPPLTKTPPGTG